MRYVFIINPVAGKGNAEQQVLPQIKQHFADNSDVSFYVTEYAGQAKDIAVAEAQKGDKVRIFACGGEGTGFEILNGIIDYKNVELGVVPCGSANDFLKYYGDREDFTDIKELINGVAVPIDIIKADEFYCINGCSVGMDAVVADDMRLFKKWPLVSGSMAYKLAIVKTFLRKLGCKLKITINGTAQSIKNCLFVVCANGPVYGGGYISAPNAQPSDGKLDYTVVQTVPKFKIPSFLKLYEKGKHAQLPFCELGNCNTLEVEAEKAVPINLDGEIIHRKKIKFSIIKQAVNFVLPQKTAGRLVNNAEKVTV